MNTQQSTPLRGMTRKLQQFSRDITGIKLEPIVALSSLQTAGAELLSVLSAERQSECFFRDLPAEQALTLLAAQLATLNAIQPCSNLFINLPMTVFTAPKHVQQLLQMKTPPLNIEIVDPAHFLTLPPARQARAIARLKRLKMAGHRLWLDDVDEALVQPFLSCRLPLSGIKIDKRAFWRLRTSPALAQLVAQCSQLAAHVLIEGIETDRDYACALQAGAGYGQGYYWPSWRWPED